MATRAVRLRVLASAETCRACLSQVGNSIPGWHTAPVTGSGALLTWTWGGQWSSKAPGRTQVAIQALNTQECWVTLTAENQAAADPLHILDQELERFMKSASAQLPIAQQETLAAPPIATSNSSFTRPATMVFWGVVALTGCCSLFSLINYYAIAPGPSAVTFVFVSLVPLVLILAGGGLFIRLRSRQWNWKVWVNWGVGAALILYLIIFSIKIQQYEAECWPRVGPGADLTGCNLSQADLTGRDLQGTNFRAARLDDAQLAQANLSGANFANASALRADFRAANLNRAILSQVFFNGADFTAAQVAGVIWEEANLSNATLQGLELSGANLARINLTSANLQTANLTTAQLYTATLRHADLTGARVTGAIFDHADLRAAQLSGLDFSGASLRSADLREANLQNTTWQGADLSKANLEAANLAQADLTGAILYETQLTGAQGLTDTQLAAALEAPLTNLPAALSARGLWLEERRELRKTLATACKNQPVPDAGHYTPGDTFHPIMLIDDAKVDLYDWLETTPPNWEPMALRFAELVACLQEQEKEKIGTCNYEGGLTLPRYRYQLAVQLKNADTGQAIETVVIYGSQPACPAFVKVPGQPDIIGQPIKFEDIEPALIKFVNPPDLVSLPEHSP